MEVLIYKLYDPRDTAQSPRYIGITSKTLKIRLNSHLNTHYLKRKPATHKINWINSLLKGGIYPKIKLIETVDSWKYGCEREIFWIKYYKDRSENLTNLTEGGEGTPGLKRSEDFLKKISKIHKGRKHTEETKLKMSLADKGRVVSESTKLRISNSTKGKKKSTLHSEKLRKLFGKPVIVEFFDTTVIEFATIRECSKYLNTTVDSVRWNIINKSYGKLKCMIKFKENE